MRGNCRISLNSLVEPVLARGLADLVALKRVTMPLSGTYQGFSIASATICVVTPSLTAKGETEMFPVLARCHDASPYLGSGVVLSRAISTPEVETTTSTTWTPTVFKIKAQTILKEP